MSRQRFIVSSLPGNSQLLMSYTKKSDYLLCRVTLMSYTKKSDYRRFIVSTLPGMMSYTKKSDYRRFIE